MSEARPLPSVCPPGDRLVSVSQIADMTSMSVVFWRKRIASGDLPSLRVGRRVRVRLTDLATWLLDAGRRPDTRKYIAHLSYASCAPRG
jgi:excisionase family DNA binding protein